MNFKTKSYLSKSKKFIQNTQIWGYRRIRDELDGHKGIHVNDKRVPVSAEKCDIKSNIKWKPKSCTRGERNPDHVAKKLFT